VVLGVTPTQRTLWWERYPERLAAEFEALDSNGIRYERDLEAESQGVLRLRLWYPLDDGTELHLITTFPDNYPFFRFEVEAPDIELPYHQHARVRNLCLLPRRTDLWHPSSDHLGDILRSQLKRVLTVGGKREILSELSDEEEHQAEPYSDYYDYLPNAILLVDSSWSIPQNAQYGDLLIGLETPSGLVRGAILEVTDERGTVVVQASEELATNYKASVKARWSRLNPPPSARLTAAEIYRSARERDLSGIELKQPVQGGRIAIKGVLFPEEIRWRGLPNGTGDGWLFVIRFEPEQPSPKKNKGRKLVHVAEQRYYLARAGRSGRSDLSVRIPELAPLAHRCVAQFGLGCLGAPSSLEFARTGLGDLRILDYDFVEPGSVVRWPIGLTAAGYQKTQKLLETISFNYPYTKLVAYNWKIGATRDQGDHENEILDKMLDGVDLVYDATAEYGVQRFLASLAAERGLPYVGVHSTAGGWGGIVVRIRPAVTEGCWQCLQWANAEGMFPIPSFDEKGDQLQPAGCADPTYTGANFDLMQVAMAGVRTVVSTLCGGQEAAYPKMDWDVAILDLRNEIGQAIAPTWHLFTLGKHPRCETCGTPANI
jgi:hypothetical protein